MLLVQPKHSKNFEKKIKIDVLFLLFRHGSSYEKVRKMGEIEMHGSFKGSRVER